MFYYSKNTLFVCVTYNKRKKNEILIKLKVKRE